MNVTMAIASNATTLSMLSVLGTYAALRSRGTLGPSRLFTIVTALGLLNAPLMLVGRAGRLDFLTDGRAADPPALRGLSLIETPAVLETAA